MDRYLVERYEIVLMFHETDQLRVSKRIYQELDVIFSLFLSPLRANTRL